jgi:hypothetical protein
MPSTKNWVSIVSYRRRFSGPIECSPSSNSSATFYRYREKTLPRSADCRRATPSGTARRSACPGTCRTRESRQRRYGRSRLPEGGPAPIRRLYGRLTRNVGTESHRARDAQGSRSFGQSGVFQEVELRVRTPVAPHRLTGYEITCSVNVNDPYLQVVKWNGLLAGFSILDGRPTGCADGNTLKATVSGTGQATIPVYKNGMQLLRVIDRHKPFTPESPGIGFFSKALPA